MRKNFLLSLVVPVFNESEVVSLFNKKVRSALSGNLSIDLEIIFVNDGSNDETLTSLITLQADFPDIKIIDLTRNFGKEAALTAGLKHVTGQMIVPIDADLQDPPELILDMIDKWQDGYEVVLARRADRSSDHFLKRLTAACFYRIAGDHIPKNVGDYRLMDKAVVEALNLLPENQRFMKGLFAWLGFKTCTIDYTRKVREKGDSKFNFWKLWNLALEGITSFSTMPLKIWTYIGLFISFTSFSFGTYMLFSTLVNGNDVPGYTSTLIVILFMGGVQLIGIGVIGEYLGRTYLESKNRPPYLIRKIYITGLGE
jgi:polyisoprenyl-phosphate glycosyltransferase